MKRGLLILLAAGLALGRLGAQASSGGDIKITFADGHQQSASAVRRSNNTILATIALAAGVRGETGFALSSIRKIEFPEPPQLKAARRAIDAGKPADALGLLNVVVDQQSALRTVPGNWWAPAAILKMDALLALGREKEAETLIKQLSTDAKDPEQAQDVRIAQAYLWLHGGRQDQAIEAFDKLIAESSRPATLARSWQGKGEALLAKQDYDGAALAYLRLPIFYSNETALLPAALLGRARAYEGLRDFDHANDTLAELNKTYPSSPEAASSKADSERIQKKMKAGASVQANL